MERLKGFTIVELMVVMGIFGIISSTVVVIYFQLVQASNRASIAAQVEQNASYAMEIMVREIRAASCVGGGGEILEIKDANCEEAVVTFTKDGQDLVKITDEGEFKLNDPERVRVKLLSFGLDSSGRSVTIDLEMESTQPAAHTQFRGEISLHETVSLRKY